MWTETGGVTSIYAGWIMPNALYRNLGDWRFTDITASAGVARAMGQASTGAVLVDLDGDSDLDLLVNGAAAGTRLFLNDGKGRCREATETSGLNRRGGSTSPGAGRHRRRRRPGSLRRELP